MKKIIALCAFLAASPCFAKKEIKPLPLETAPKLQGKTMVVTRHKVPSFSAFSPGAATFGVLGALGAIGEGNRLIRENEVADPADIIEQQLIILLEKHYGLQAIPTQNRVIDVEKPKAIAATQSNVDYVLDVRSTGWMHSYDPKRWGEFWVAYSAQARLIDAKDGKLISDVGCISNTQKQPNSPSKKSLWENNALLMKNVTTMMGWVCARIIANGEFHIAVENLPAIPSAYLDPLGDYAKGKIAMSPPGAEVKQDDAGASVPISAEPAVDASKPNDSSLGASESGVEAPEQAVKDE